MRWLIDRVPGWLVWRVMDLAAWLDRDCWYRWTFSWCTPSPFSGRMLVMGTWYLRPYDAATWHHWQMPGMYWDGWHPGRYV